MPLYFIRFFIIFSLLGSYCVQAAVVNSNHHGSHHTSTSQASSHNHDNMMHGMYGLYPMTREASGTSWEPDSTPFVGISFMRDDWMFMSQGFANFIYDHQGSSRGDEKFFSNNMLMFMGQKDIGAGTFGFRTMFSLDPLMGKSGYPLILQTGETANGVTPLIDRQHPHDFFMELAPTYSYDFSNHSSIFIYAGLPGEPALGPPAFMHRFSAMDNPEAPLTHHWLDSTHITYGVITLGYVWNQIKLEGSIFNGHEPDQYRWNIESPQLNSYSARISYNPCANWSLQISSGHLQAPEQLAPNVNTNRTTASVIYNRPFAVDDNWATTLAWGQDANHPGHTLNGYLLETEINLEKTHTFFGRIERVSEDELFANDQDSPFFNQVFTVNKLSLGYIYDFLHLAHALAGIGTLGSVYQLPAGVQTAYGEHPFSYMIFARVKMV